LSAPSSAAVPIVAEKIKKGLAPDGFTYGINQGRAAGQEVDHLHIHVLPRYEGDGGGPIQAVVNNLPKEGLAEIAKKIRES